MARDVETDLGLNLISTAPIIDNNPGGAQTIPSVSQPANVFLLRPDINLLSTLRALEARDALEMLSEPNVMAIDGKQASFVIGGEFPFPTVQAGGVGIQFREVGLRLNFLPNITPRDTVCLQVASEVSFLDFAHSVTFQDFTLPTPTSFTLPTPLLAACRRRRRNLKAGRAS